MNSAATTPREDTDLLRQKFKFRIQTRKIPTRCKLKATKRLFNSCGLSREARGKYTDPSSGDVDIRNTI